MVCLVNNISLPVNFLFFTEEKYICTKAYKASLQDEITLAPGDIVFVREKHPDGWWLVK